MQRVLRSASLGQLEDRVTHIPDDGSDLSKRGLKGVFASTAAGLNDAIISIAAGNDTQIRGEMADGFSNLGGGISQGLVVIQRDIITAQENSTEIVN